MYRRQGCLGGILPGVFLLLLLLAQSESASIDYDGNQSDLDGEQELTVRKRTTTAQPRTLKLDEINQGNKYNLTSKFLSLGLSTKVFQNLDIEEFAGLNSLRFKTLAEAMSPAIVRIGGEHSPFYLFDSYEEDVTATLNRKFKEKFNATMFGRCVGGSYCHKYFKSEEWQLLAKFFNETGWQANFNLNAFLWDEDGKMSTRNHQQFMKDINWKHHLDQFMGFSLFNEPAKYTHKYGNSFSRTPDECVTDMGNLEKMMNYDGMSFIADKWRIGPDSASISKHPKSYTYLEEFLKNGGAKQIRAVSLHHFSFNAKTASWKDFIDVKNMDLFAQTVEMGRDLINKYNSSLQLHITETAPAYGKGSEKYSDAYAATFMLMDNLGTAAYYGADVMNLYFYYENNGLVQNECKPTPSYWLAVTHKRLIDGPVLKAWIVEDDPNVRLYAQCARPDFNFRNRDINIGAVVMTWVNVNDYAVELKTAPYDKTNLFVWSFTGDTTKTVDKMMQDENIYVNGEQAIFDNEVPYFAYKEYKDTPTLELPKYSTGFVMLPWAFSRDCMNRPASDYPTPPTA